jgi:hypothetical protein
LFLSPAGDRIGTGSNERTKIKMLGDREMQKKNLVETIKKINLLADIDTFENMLFDLSYFEIITYKEYITLLDILYERKEQIL